MEEQQKRQQHEQHMQSWTTQKVDAILDEAVAMAAWLHKAADRMPAEDCDQAAEYLHEIIRLALRVSAARHGHEECLEHQAEWIGVLMNQGKERLTELRELMRRDAADKSPSRYPASIQRMFDLLERISSALRQGTSDRTEYRSLVLETARELRSSQLGTLQKTGDILLELVDEQAVEVRISWDEFVRRVASAVESAQQKLPEEIAPLIKLKL